jgi:WD40 repeat protein
MTNCASQPTHAGGTPSSISDLRTPPASSATPLPIPRAVDLGVLGKGSARDVAWSPDGKLMAVTSSIGVDLYDTQTWQMVKTIPETGFGDQSINSTAFSRDGKRLILLVYKYTIYSFWQYDLQNEQAVPWLENLMIDPQTAPVFSPDDNTFAFLNQICDKQSCTTSLELRKSATGKLLYTLGLNDRDFVFSPDGKQLAASNQDNHIRVWDTTSGKLRYEFLHDSGIASLDFSIDGQVLASASKDATARFWDMQTGKSLFVLRGFKQGLQYVAYHDNGKKILIGQLYDNITQAYALDKRHLPTNPIDITMELGKDLDEYTPADTKTTATIRLSPDTHKLAVLLNQSVQVWDAETGQPILTLPGYNSQIYALEFSPDGDLLALADHNVHIWQISTQKFVTTVPINAYEIGEIAFQPKGHQIAIIAENSNVQIWDTLSHQKVREISENIDGDNVDMCSSSLAAFSPDGKKMATASYCGIRIWDAASGRLLQKLAVEGGSPYKLAFSMDGKELVYVAGRGIWRWNLVTGKPILSAQFTEEKYGSIALSSNLIALGEGLDGPFRFFSPITGQHLYDFAEGRGGTTVALDPNGRLFARSDYGQILLADSVSGNKLFSIDFDLPYFIQFSSDGRLLAASSYKNTAYLWDISTAAKFAQSTIPITATPDPALIPTPTITPDPIAPLSIQSLTPPTLGLGAIRPETITQLETRGELGLGQAHVAAWAPDGKTLAVGISSGAYIFELGAVQPTHFLPADQGIVLLSFSRDTRLLAGQISNMDIQVWDASTGRSLYKLDDAGCWNQGMTFSPDNQVLSTDCGDATFRWNMSDGRLLAKDEKRASLPETSPDGSLVVQAGMVSAQLLASNNDEIIKTFDVPEMAPALAKFSPDGKTLLVWFYKFEVARTGMYYPGPDSRSLIQLWNIIPNRLPTLRTILVPGKWLPETIVVLEAFQGLAFSPNSLQVVTAGGDGQAQIWDVNSGKLLSTLPDARNIYFSSDGKKLVSVGRNVQVWDVSIGKQPELTWNIPGFADPASLLMFDRNSNQLVEASSGAFRFWPHSGGTFAEYPAVLEAPDVHTTMLSASPDGKWLAYSTSDKLVLGENIPNAPNWQTLEKFGDLPYQLETRALIFSPDSSLLAVADPDRKVLLWRLGQPETKPLELTSDIYIASLLFNPDGTTLLGADGFSSKEETLYLWDTTTGKLLRKWQTLAYLPTFHPDGTTLAVSNYDDGAIRLYDLRTWSVLREMKGPRYIRSMGFSPDGSLLAALYDGKIEFWDVVTGKLLRTLEGNFSHLAFSPDGRYLAISLWDGRIQYWGLPTQ